MFIEKVLILGGSGLIGKAIINELSDTKQFEIYATYHNNLTEDDRCIWKKLDISNIDCLINMLEEIRPTIIISSLRGEFEQQLILHTKIAEYIKETNGKLVYFSTANVFDTSLSKPYYEDDNCDSKTDYGQFKIACEEQLIKILTNQVIIIRLPQIWGRNSPRLKSLHKSIENNEKIIVYPKLFINIESDVNIAKKVLYLLNKDDTGIFHFSSKDIITHKELYEEILKKLKISNDILEENNSLEGYFSLLSIKDGIFPKDLIKTNREIIDNTIE